MLVTSKTHYVHRWRWTLINSEQHLMYTGSMEDDVWSLKAENIRTSVRGTPHAIVLLVDG